MTEKSNLKQTFLPYFIFMFSLVVVGSITMLYTHINNSYQDKVIQPDIMKDTVYQQVEKVDTYLDKLIKKKSCLEMLLLYEISGIKKELECGTSSGRKGEGLYSKEIQNQIDEILKKIEIEKGLDTISSFDSKQRKDSIIYDLTMKK
jgi:hypothetical protein